MDLQNYRTFADYASYLTHPLVPETRNLIIASLARQLSDLDFDQVVVSGVSGISMGSMLAFLLDKPLAVIRKNTEDGHSSKTWEGRHGGRCIFVDDFVSTGQTMTRMAKEARNVGAKVVACVFYATDKPYGLQYSDTDTWRFEAKLSGVPIIVPQLQDEGFESLGALVAQRYKEEEVAA